jgi:methionyl-tRNA synthetase
VRTCPKCEAEEAYGDQCEQCGSTLNATDLINPKSTITRRKPYYEIDSTGLLWIMKFLKEWILVGHK